MLKKLTICHGKRNATFLHHNSVTAPIHFDHRLQCLFHDIILSNTHPLGIIKHYMYIEFQQRGSPHYVLWVKGAPSHEESEDVLQSLLTNIISLIK